jgi:hypothetical protein
MITIFKTLSDGLTVVDHIVPGSWVHHTQYPDGDCEYLRYERAVAGARVPVGIREYHRALPGDRGARGRDVLEA